MGVLGYFRKFVKGFAELTKPIYDCCRVATQKLDANLSAKSRAKAVGKLRVKWTAAA